MGLGLVGGIIVSEKNQSYVVVAEFSVLPGKREEFLVVAKADAEASVTKEAGCLQFDWAISAEDENAVLFYEVYTSREAFEEHMQQPHFADFKRDGTPLLAKDPVVRFFLR